jgi:hypothetical protein
MPNIGNYREYIMLIQYGCLAAEQREKLTAAGIKKSDYKNALPFLCHHGEVWKTEFNKLSIMFYIDRYGNFLSNKTKTAQIVQAIYNSLEKDDQRDVMKYLMESEDDESDL